MNKMELQEALMTSEAGKDLAKLSKAGVERVVTACFDTMAEALGQGESVKIVGFGSLNVKTRAARVGINPRTKEKMQYPAKKTVTFSPAGKLKELLNG